MIKIPCTFPIEPEPEEVEVEMLDRRERDRKMLDWFKNVLHILNAYQSHQGDAIMSQGERDLRMSTHAMALALGFPVVAGADGPAELARKCHVSKQALTKCLNHFTEQLRLAPLPGQRKESARQQMVIARKRQLTNHHDNNRADK